ncbi:hypothetical protein GCM10010174_79380 [Kutzneria viridogrisea]|uniref:Amino acid adenylation domain-containing protein n=1 Tax=Kutzneria viridogrisea TaxID=47990 RepID=A0ABR6BBG1_9PSEU|nr:amino acid adenylation domain-containing protein [Kutzneria viridogrisea]
MTDLAARIAELQPGKRAELRRRLWERGIVAQALDGEQEYAPPSFTQRRMVFLHEMDRHSTAYVSSVPCRLTGRVRPDALEHALNEILLRHEALRTALVVHEGEIKQRVRPAEPRQLPIIDLTGLSPTQRQQELRRLMATEESAPFDLATDPLVRFHLLRMDWHESILLLTFHHAVVDGWALAVFSREVAALYDAYLADKPSPLPELPLQYADYARWQQDWLASEEAADQIGYWTAQLARAPELLRLPTDRPRPAHASYRGAAHNFVVPDTVLDRIHAVARETGATLYMVLLAAFQTVLARYSGQDDILVGTAVANRRFTEFHSLIGFFANSVVLRGRPSGHVPFREFVRHTRTTCLAAYEHQDIPLDLLVQTIQPERDLSRNPVYQVNCVLHNQPEAVEMAPGMVITPLEVEQTGARFDLDLSLVETPAGLECQLIYATDLFDHSTVARIARSFTVLLEAAAHAPDTLLRDLPMMTEDDQRRLFTEGTGTDRAVPDTTVVELVEAQAQRTPDAIAVTASTEELTYRELSQRASAFAEHLRGLGVGRGSLVGVLLSRSPALPVTLLGIMKAGAAYVPLDPQHPDARLRWLLDDSTAGFLVTESQFANRLRPETARIVLVDEWSADGALSEVRCRPDDPMYVIYTSGSTGGPKGVMLSHRNLVNYLLWAVEAFAVAEGDGVPLHSSLSADMTVTSVFAPLLVGQRLILLDESGAPGEALRTCAERMTNLSLVKLTPSHLQLLADAAVDSQWARSLVVGGEALYEEQLPQWHTARLFNEYGPTETAVACACYETADQVGSRVPIGRPIHNTCCYVLDDRMRPVPVGVAGELHVGGAGVSHGYWRRPDLTAERFVPDPFGQLPGGRLYRTGDLVRWRGDGELEFLSRVDDQAKVRGHRVEPGEIAAVLEGHQHVRQAAVEVADRPSGAELVAFVRVEAGTPDPGQAENVVDQWEMLYQNLYGDLQTSPTPFFDLAGWTSSFTGSPIAEDEMRSWLDNTVAAIHALRPRHALEIGCGTGMILARVAPECVSYRATDLSASVVDHVREALAQAVPDLVDRVDLRAAPAHRSITEGDEYDTVIMNSVVQYFPSVDYLTDIIRQAVAAIPVRGHVFVGDVRNFAMLDLFHTDVVMHQAANGDTAGTLRARVRRGVDGEEELCVDPRLFTDLAQRWERVSAVRVVPKPGPYRNELVSYRYDVVIEVGGNRLEQSEWDSHNAVGMDLAAIENLLTGGQPRRIQLRNLTNSRLSEALGGRAALADAPAGEVPRASVAAPEGIDPDEVRALAERLSYEVDLSWAAGAPDGSYDVLLQPTSAPAVANPAAPKAAGSGEYANDPMWRTTAARRLTAVAAHAKAHLPAHMVPARYVLLREFPLTPSGKVDHLVLRELMALDDRSHAHGRDARPLTPTERTIADIWEELLVKDGIGSDDHFFELGGHSLLTFQLLYRLRDALGVDIPIRTPFEKPVLADMAAAVEELCAQASGSTTPALAPVPRTTLMPTSRAQERLWFLHQLAPDNPRYNVPLYVRLTGDLDVPALHHALNEIVRRHEVLRTVLVTEDGRPYQSVQQYQPVDLVTVDVSTVDDPEAEAMRLALAESVRAFDLANGPVMRTHLVRLSATEHLLLVSVHHISFDGWSTGVLLDEFSELYAARQENRPPVLPDLPVQYADYAVWQRCLLDEGHLAKARDYWRDQLAGILEIPALPMTRPREAPAQFVGHRVEFTIPSTTADKIHALARQEDATLFMVLLSALYALLHERTGSTDLAVGANLANRSDPAVENLIGFFVNQVVLRTTVDGEPTWRELVCRARATTLAAYAHQDLPFEEVVKVVNPPRDRGHSPLFQTNLMLDNTRRGNRTLPGVRLDPLEFDLDTTRFDLTLLMAEEGTTIVGAWEYDVQVFDRDAVTLLAADYVRLVTALAEQPDHRAELSRPRPERGKTHGMDRNSVRGRLRELKRTAPKKVIANSADLVGLAPLAPGTTLPVVATPNQEQVDLVAWARNNRAMLDDALLTSGALLFRGFEITESEELERFASVFVTDLFVDNGEHSQSSLNGRAYPPTLFPPEEKLLWHNRDSFNDSGPGRIWFCVKCPATWGGETPIVDSRVMYRTLHPDLRAEFAAKNVMYLRGYGTGLGLDWRTAFRTDSRAEVQARCVAQGLRYEWRDDRLYTSAVRPSVLRHPVSGEWSWFNQAQHWHLSCLDERTRKSILATFDRDELPRDCRFGDGTPIPDDAMAEICRVYAELEVSFPWQVGDVLMLDNISVAHARNPFGGERKLLVAMGDMMSFG